MFKKELMLIGLICMYVCIYVCRYVCIYVCRYVYIVINSHIQFVGLIVNSFMNQ